MDDVAVDLKSTDQLALSALVNGEDALNSLDDSNSDRAIGFLELLDDHPDLYLRERLA